MLAAQVEGAAMFRKRAVLFAMFAVLGLAALGMGCQTPPPPPRPVVNVQAPPCNCECAYTATAPQIGKGCWVEGDRLICPLVRRSIEVEPAYPSEDPRCVRQPDGTTRCTVDPGN